MRPLRRFIRRLALAVTAATCRRRLLHPGQATIRGYAALVAAYAMGLPLAGAPAPMVAFVAVATVAVFVCLKLPGHGARLADVATLLTLVLLIAAFLLPQIERTRDRTAGRRYFPSMIPGRFTALVRGLDDRPPF